MAKVKIGEFVNQVKTEAGKIVRLEERISVLERIATDTNGQAAQLAGFTQARQLAPQQRDVGARPQHLAGVLPADEGRPR